MEKIAVMPLSADTRKGAIDQNAFNAVRVAAFMIAKSHVHSMTIDLALY